MLRTSIRKIMNNGRYVKMFQKMFKLKQDGVVGNNTLRTLQGLCDEEMLKFLNSHHYVSKEQPTIITDSKKNKILNYLSKTEGIYLHYNKGEKTVTSPYGIYLNVNPHADVYKYFINLLHDNLPEGSKLFKFTLKNLLGNKWTINLFMLEYKDFINNLLTYNPKVREYTMDLVYTYYVDHYMVKRILPYLTDKEALSITSIAILTGRRRCITILQKSLNISADGVIGNQTVQAIKDRTYTFNDKFLNNVMRYLRSLNKKRYIKGWTNRIDALR